MSIQIPPPPPPGAGFESNQWQTWLLKLYQQQVIPSTVTWGNIDFTGSNITSIQTRQHNSLQSLQGGASGDYYHLTSSQVTDVLGNGIGTVTTIGVVNGSQNISRSQLTPRVLTLTGALTANATLVFDSSAVGDWIVVNNTTGAFTTTISSGGGGPSVVVTQTKTAHIYSTGAGIYRAAPEV